MKKEQGLIGLYVTIVVLLLMVGIIASIGFGVLAQQRIIRNITESAQAYQAAESGIEDGLGRLHNGMTLPGSYPYSLQVGSAQAEVIISPIFSGSRIITSMGDSSARVRTAEAVYEITTTNAEFFYGAHVGDGGLRLGANSGVWGNVFSNGDVAFGDNAGVGGIFAGVPGSLIVAGAGHRAYHTSAVTDLSNTPFINGDATVDICEDVASITDDLIANFSVGSVTCGAIDTPLGTPPEPIPLPILPSSIQEWKDAAVVGGVITGDVTIPYTGVPVSRGPQKIEGNLIVENNAELIITGTLWVTGSITINNNAFVHLDSGYGSTSGIIVSSSDGGPDGVITLVQNSVSRGSGSPGSYLMYLSTSSLDPGIEIQNNAQADVIYASNGWISIKNNANLREVTGYGVKLGNNAGIIYETGLQTTMFANGTGGGWEVVSWKEIP